MLEVYILIIFHELLNFFIRLLVRPKGEKFDLLLVRTDGIGDYIIWLDSLRAYKEAFKDKKCFTSFLPKSHEFYSSCQIQTAYLSSAFAILHNPILQQV